MRTNMRKLAIGYGKRKIYIRYDRIHYVVFRVKDKLHLRSEE